MLENQENFDSAPKVPERRAHPRLALRSLAYLQLDAHNGGMILNIGEGGVAVQAAEVIAASEFPRMRFRLPQSEKWLEVSGKLVWHGSTRKEAGIQFVNVSAEVRRHIIKFAASATFSTDLPTGSDASVVQDNSEPGPAAKDPSQSDISSEIEAMFPSERSLPLEPASSRSDTSGGLRGAATGVARAKQPDNLYSPVYTYDLPIRRADQAQTGAKQSTNAQHRIESASSSRTAIETCSEALLAHDATNDATDDAIDIASDDPSVDGSEFEPGNSAEGAHTARKSTARNTATAPSLGGPSSPTIDPIAGGAFYEELLAVHSSAVDARQLRAAWRPPESFSEKLASPRPENEGISFTGFGYQPTAFEEPGGRAWLPVAAILLVLLVGGMVMAMGPAHVKQLLFRRAAPDISDMAGPPPPADAFTGTTPRDSTVPSAENSNSTSASSNLNSRPTNKTAPVPVTGGEDAPPDAVVSAAPQHPDYGASPASTAPRQDDPDEAETREEAEAKVRQFQLEHSTASVSAPAGPYASSTEQPAAAPPVAAQIPGPAPPVNGPSGTHAAAIPSPAASSAMQGVVAISSHFESIRGEESAQDSSLHVGQLRSFRQPSYPVEAIRAHVEGTVTLSVLVDPAGTVESVKLISGPPMLVFAAINSVWQWRYNRTTLNGRAVESVEEVTVAFRLGNSASSPR
jgi:protein TonB